MLLARSFECSRTLLLGLSSRSSSSSAPTTPYVTPEEKRGQFRVLDIGLRPAKVATPRGRRSERERELERKKQRGMVQEPVKPQDRHHVMRTDQSWESVWPSARTFHPSAVPLPVRQGYIQLKNQIHPDKHANVELMKVPNFLHLTPPAIARQCGAIKKFCTEYPQAEKTLKKTMPMLGTSHTYLNASSDIRDHRARVFTLQVPLSALKLPPAAKEKFLRLVRERYDPTTDTVTIVCDACPYLKQNREYAEYLLTAAYHEAFKREPWEEDKFKESDAVDYKAETADMEQAQMEALDSILNKGEDDESISNYKKAVLNMIQANAGKADQ